ncbi:MAG: LCP family protein [Bacilli bacterium]|nr:LCP family protein [Bacilli bacterium]
MKKNDKQETKKNSKFLNLLSGIIVGMFICITIYLIYNIFKLKGIEDILRYIVVGILILVCLIVLIKYLRFKKKGKIGKYILFILILIIFGALEFFASSVISRGISVIDKISKNKITYTSALISMKDGKYTNINKVKEAKIGIITDKEDVEGYVLAQNIIDKDNIKDSQLVEYDDYITMLNDLYEDEVNAIFISGSYADKFSTMEKFSDIKDDVVVLDKYSKLMKKIVDNTTKSSSKKVTEPFTMLLLGVDSETEDISKTSGLGDTIMLVTFNPKTLNATIFSIPRDTFVPVSCYRNALSKITHAASGGDSCMIKTVENFTGIDIDYYAKVNFKGLINLVDALGGIDVDVPYALCESDETRSYANTIFIEKGWQHLNGRQALALSRNRKNIPWCGPDYNKGVRNDFVRGQNQQLVVKAIMNKAKTIKSVNQLYDILDTISISLDTNLTRDQILDFYNVLKKILLNSDSLSDTNDIINMQKTYLNGSGGIIYDNIANMDLYEYVPSSQSLNAIIKAMKVNLELEEEEYETSFSFTIDKEYKPKVIGSDLYGGVKKYPSKGSDTQKPENTCSTNEELGADNVTCVCKNGYERTKEGTCEKKETNTCSTNEELGADKVTCVCKNGYTRNEKTGKCEKENSSGEKNINMCVAEDGYYYWYDSEGNKNPTQYIDSTCSTKKEEKPIKPSDEPDTPESGENGTNKPDTTIPGSTTTLTE